MFTDLKWAAGLMHLLHTQHCYFRAFDSQTPVRSESCPIALCCSAKHAYGGLIWISQVARPLWACKAVCIIIRVFQTTA